MLFSCLIFIVFLLVAIMPFLVLRHMYKDKSEKLDEEIQKISAYVPDYSNVNSQPQQNSYDRARERLEQECNRPFDDLADVLEHRFKNHIIAGTEKEAFVEQYRELFKEAYTLKRKLIFFCIQPSARLTKFIDDYGDIHGLVKKHNELVISARLEENREFFNHCLDYPLDEQQRRAIVSEEDNCLVVSSAGSGKTSSIVGKVKYLIERQGVDAKKILMISYTNKAAAELTERTGISCLRGYTFHKLALDIIGKVTGQKPSICDNTDALFVKIYHDLLSDIQFREAVLEYFVDYQELSDDSDAGRYDKQMKFSEQKSSRKKALLPDMDGNDIYVKSEQEQKICFALSSLGIKFRYEEPYEHSVADEMHSQYKPDFSIYYEKEGHSKRIYLEHFAIDEHGLVPFWFALDRGISYGEANRRYGDGITWKRETHKKYGTTMLETSSADFHYYDIREKLRDILTKAGVPTHQIADEELYEQVLPQNGKKEKAFIRLIVTFVTLLKSSCKSINDILNDAPNYRSKFVIKRLVLPVYERYMEVLRENGLIDFTDAILWATKLCETTHPLAFSYIIVDEFQDISIDRYLFLKALRAGTPPAKLYCVGDDWQSIYRFSGSDMALFNHFADYFGATEINKIETTYRFGEPLVSISSQFIQRNKSQIPKNIHPFSANAKTELFFYPYDRSNYCETIEHIIAQIPAEKSIFLLGRYSFDDYDLSCTYKSINENGRLYYVIDNRKIEFLTVHKSKGLEADYVIILQCNKDTYGFPSMVGDDPVLNCVLTESDKYPFGEERRLFYVAITRAKIQTIVLYNQKIPSVFVRELLNPETLEETRYSIHPNANKKWTQAADIYLLTLHREGKSIKDIALKMGRSQTSIIMRLGKLETK